MVRHLRHTGFGAGGGLCDHGARLVAPCYTMPAAPSSSSAKSSVDVRTLSLVQLQKLAERGSRRAKAELEGRMRASATDHGALVASSAAPQARPQPSPLPASAPRPPAGPIPTLTERAAAASATSAIAAPLATPPADAPPAPHDALAQQLEMIARQDEARARADGPPRLVGLVLIAWGVMLLFGGLVMLSRGGGLYYLFCGVGSAAVGWLLMQCSRWALLLHGALLLVALAWAWQITKGSAGLALVQAAPLWIAALWMAVRPVREPLE